MGYVFISYSTKNQVAADTLNHFLNENGINTWMAPYDIPVGFKYAQVITDAIKDCDCLVLLLTDAAQSSNWIPREVERAVNFGKRILPIMLEQVVELTGDFQLYISVNHSICVQKIDPASEEMQKIIASIRSQNGTSGDIYRVGNIIDGKYEILELIEQGDDFDVFISQDRQLNQYIVRALYKRAGKSSPLSFNVSMLNRQLCHPMLPQMIDVVDHKDHILTVSHCTKGTPLSAIIQEQGAQSEETVLHWAKELADCLNYLHGQSTPVFLTHLQPNQLMVSSDGTLRLRNIIPLSNGPAPVCRNDSVWTAPECQNGNIDARTDVFALGSLLYSLITGKDFSKPPYVVLPIRANNPQLSQAMEQIVLKCIEPDPKNRYQTIVQLQKDLENIDKINYKGNRPSFIKHLFSAFKKGRQQ